MKDSLHDLFSQTGSPTTPSTPTPERPRRRSLVSFFPLSLLGGYLLLVGLLFGDRFVSARELELAPVVTLKSGNVASPASPNEIPYSAATLFQATGWVEAAPLPIRATALVDGVVDEVFVLEGEVVRKGQVLATLIDDDARLDYETAVATLNERRAALHHLEAEERTVNASFDTLELDITTARSRLEELAADADLLTEGGPEAFTGREIAQVRLRVETQEATIAALEARRAEHAAMCEAAAARVEQARHAFEQAGTEVARRKLALDRTRILSPVAGRVQELYATPGKKRMLGMDDLESATIAKIYQPEQLQARIDVPLADAGGLYVGQEVKLRTSALPNTEIRGTVDRIAGVADIQRNTLQAKVNLHNPPDFLRPEMLCRAEFLGSPRASGGIQPLGDALSIFVPEEALLTGEGTATVWKIDASGERITRQSIELTGETREGFAAVRDGLKPGDRVVLNPAADLEEGERVRAAANQRDA